MPPAGRALAATEALLGGSQSVNKVIAPSCSDQVCALWTPDIAVRPGPGCAVVEGVRSLRPERWGGTCALCRRTNGVVLRCNAGHCAAAAHALCARNAGHYLAVRRGRRARGGLRQRP